MFIKFELGGLLHDNIVIMIMLITLFFCCVGYTASGQYTNGYIIRNSGDTLRGLINHSEIGGHAEVKFEKDGQKRKFYPGDIQGYRVIGRSYVSKSINGKGPEVFLEVLAQGYCSLYIYADASHGGAGNMSTIRSVYYLQKGDEEFHKANFRLIRAGRDLYFLDNPSLTYDIQTGKYKILEFADIVKRYNRERMESENKTKKKN